MALPRDVPQRKLYPTIFAEMVANTTKPVVATAISVGDVRRIHKIASLIAGGAGALRLRPFFVMYLDPLSPLRMDLAVVRKLLFCAQKEIPILYAAGANCGATAPVTPEGGVVQGGAECLAGLVLATLKNERVPFVYGSNTSAMDMTSTIISYGDPIWFKTVAMYADMARYYDLSSWGTAGSADSITVDAQAAMEAYEGITFVVMAGTSLAHDVGFLGHGEVYDPKMLVFCDMMIARAKHLLRRVDLSDDALAVDVIDEVARHHGFYAGHPHTATHFRQALWMAPCYLDRKHVSETRLEALPGLLGSEVKRILSSHRPAPLAPDKAAKIQRFLGTI
jgi:trimethylamine--corrinoid protein Co-methyltransferase